jgi:hypothetical protein
MRDDEPYSDAEKNARELVSFQANGLHVRILAISYPAKIIRRIHVLVSPRVDDFASLTGFFKH